MEFETDQIELLHFKPEHQPYFESLNRVWIEDWFTMEEVDEWVLKNPEQAILKNGGAIVMATCNGEMAGTAGLRKIEDGKYEFTKMAVDQRFRRRGIARKICLACFKIALEKNATEILLYSNTKNANAILMYENLGFEHLPVEKGVYERANVKMRISIEKAKQCLATADPITII